MNLQSKIEAILFWKGEPLKISRLAEILKKDRSEIESSISELEKDLKNRGVVLIRKSAGGGSAYGGEDEVMLGTSPDVSKLIEDLTKEELTKDLGKAGLETLSVILYKGPITRREIDFIRGVNSTFILRNLLIRGLIEKVTNPADERSFLYKPTFELLSFLGVTRIEEIPDYAEIIAKLDNFKENTETDESDK